VLLRIFIIFLLSSACTAQESEIYERLSVASGVVEVAHQDILSRSIKWDAADRDIILDKFDEQYFLNMFSKGAADFFSEKEATNIVQFFETEAGRYFRDLTLGKIDSSQMPAQMVSQAIEFLDSNEGAKYEVFSSPYMAKRLEEQALKELKEMGFDTTRYRSQSSQ